MAQAIFVSYARVDQEFALRLAKALRGFGFDVWIDQLDIQAGKRWDREIEVALERCPAFLIVLSPASVASDNVLDEVNFALEHGKDIVPVLYQPCNVPFRLRRFQRVDFIGDESAAMNAARAALQRFKDTSGPPVITATGNVKTWPTATVHQGDLRREQERGAAARPVAGASHPGPHSVKDKERSIPTGPFRVLVGPKGQEQERWLKPGESIRDAAFAPEMVLVPPGKFWMGSQDGEGENYERPRHEVTIGYPLLVGKYPVTFDEWDAPVLAGGISHNARDQGWGRGRRPVVAVNFGDVNAYAVWLSNRIGKPYRLLTEAEWEYCCRAGTTTKYSFGDTITKQQAQFSGISVGSAKQTVEVGTFPPNAWGLYDMHGNTNEWCQDVWHDNYNGAPTDGSAWLQGRGPGVVRGGSWLDVTQILRSAYRYWQGPDDRYYLTSFRVARSID